jgi:hypothetical protein
MLPVFFLFRWMPGLPIFNGVLNIRRTLKMQINNSNDVDRCTRIFALTSIVYLPVMVKERRRSRAIPLRSGQFQSPALPSSYLTSTCGERVRRESVCSRLTLSLCLRVSNALGERAVLWQSNIPEDLLRAISILPKQRCQDLPRHR